MVVVAHLTFNIKHKYYQEYNILLILLTSVYLQITYVHNKTSI